MKERNRGRNHRGKKWERHRRKQKLLGVHQIRHSICILEIQIVGEFCENIFKKITTIYGKFGRLGMKNRERKNEREREREGEMNKDGGTERKGGFFFQIPRVQIF